MDDGSGLIGLLALALIVGLIIRNKGDNTMDTLSKGCGCLLVAVIIIFLVTLFVNLSINSE
jgi:hypothetical protein